MTSINISEADFQTVACAAMDARDDGNMTQARALDKIARKINAALTMQVPESKYCRSIGIPTQPVSWRDMPSTIEP